MKRRMSWLVSLCLLCVSLTGCWDQRNIAQRAVVLAVGVSSHHEWTFVFPNVATSVTNLTSIQPSTQYYALSAHAQSWPEAVLKIQREAPHQVSLGDLEFLLVSHRMTTADVTQVVDAIMMDGGIPASFWIASSNLSPQTLLVQTSPQVVVPTFYLSAYFNCSGCHPAAAGVRAWDWWVRDKTPGVSPILPLMTPAPNGPLVHHLDVYPAQGQPLSMPTPVTQGYMYLTGRVVNGSLSVQVKGAPYAVSRIRDSADVSLHLTQTAVQATVHIRAQGTLAEDPPGFSLTRTTEVRVGTALAIAMAQRSARAIAWANKTHTDPFGYAKKAAWLDPSVATEISPDALTSLPIHATIDVHATVQGEGVAE